MRAATVSTEGTLAFSHQLFENSPALSPERPVFFLEEGPAGSVAASYRRACAGPWISKMEERRIRVERIPQEGDSENRGVGTLHAADPAGLGIRKAGRGSCRPARLPGGLHPAGGRLAGVHAGRLPPCRVPLESGQRHGSLFPPPARLHVRGNGPSPRGHRHELVHEPVRRRGPHDDKTVLQQLDRISPVRLDELTSRAEALLKKFHE